MQQSGYILVLDQGTTGTTGALVDSSGRILWQSYQEITQYFPQPGWVEHDPVEISESCLAVIEDVLEESEVGPSQIAAIGITNQRETALVWDRSTGRPVMNAIVWQCRRTAPLCDAMISKGLEPVVRERTGLPIDAYFSGTKIRWILDNVPDGQARAERGELAFGTVDSWLVWNLTNGTVHTTDVTNASRTMLFNIDKLKWDEDLLAELDIPVAMLPEVRSSNDVIGYAGGNFFGGQSIPIAGIAGDQHAALFGQACFETGMAKNTYGTGSFLLMNTGSKRIDSTSGLLTTPAWSLDGNVTYALEGSIFTTGATVQWLRDGLGIIKDSSEVESLAASVADNGGVYLVPAFSGLGAPNWDMYARGSIMGLTRGSTAAHIARAALESTAYQIRDVLDAMTADAGFALSSLRVDGGGSVNDLMMQFQSDMLGVPIQRASVKETTALGAGYLAGLGVGFWSSLDEISNNWTSDRLFEPITNDDLHDSMFAKWHRAVDRARGWESESDALL